MQDRPTVAELLEAVRHFLSEDIVPSAEGPRRFHARVAANLMSILAREWELGEAQLEAEHERLCRLLDKPREGERSRGAVRDQVRAWTEELCARIRAGDADGGRWRREVLAHVRQTVREKLDIANPRYE